MLLLMLMFVVVGWAEGDCPGEDRRLAPRPLANPTHLPVCEAPYRDPNCTCPPAKFECACHKIDKCGTNRDRCIDGALVFDQTNHCGDWSDEISDICPANRFECHCFNTSCPGPLGCISTFWLCDGQNKCPDGSDETGCSCPADSFQCACYGTKNCKIAYGCISKSALCDWENDCGDGSDEVNCTCPADRFECPCYKARSCTKQAGCIPSSWLCDGGNDCGDMSDEVDCIDCPADSFVCDCSKTGSCLNARACIDKSWRCDGDNDCGDWSDEANCTCPTDKLECPCYATKSCTKRRGCIRKSKQCNGANDCGDWSDEHNCSCPIDTFECPCFTAGRCFINRGCISMSSKCDGTNHCGDWSDELNCTCPAHKFECSCYATRNCHKKHGYISKFRQCDGNNDCGDGSDEANCSCPPNTFECACYTAGRCSKKRGCISQFKVCDGSNHCGDWSDERNCTCPARRFECPCYAAKRCGKKRGCISKSRQCDGIRHCRDGSDESNCKCPEDMFECACVGLKECVGENINCIDRSLMCDGKPDCVDGSDEMQSLCQCLGTEVKCPCDHNNTDCSTGGRCIPVNWIADNLADCPDGSDEICFLSRWTCQSCNVVAVTCPAEARHLVEAAPSYRCNAVLNGACATDNTNCTADKVVCTAARCESLSDACGGAFFCENQQLIPKAGFCDRSEIDCEDKSDEAHQPFGFKCSGPLRKDVCTLPQINVYDSEAQCSDNSDICFLDGQFRCFQCLDKKLIVSSRQVCDGVVDCFDMSDECLCTNQSLCRAIRGGCDPNQLRCTDGSECVALKGVLCNPSVRCADRINTKYCIMNSTPRRGKCTTRDGKCKGSSSLHKNNSLYTAALRNYGRPASNDSQTLDSSWCDGILKDKFGFVGEKFCPHRFACFAKKKVNIERDLVCDGTADCDDASDEFFELCQESVYYCQSRGRLSIDKRNVCDGVIDCDDKSDESQCRCEGARFYCTKGQTLSVERRLVQNGIDDCTDGSDECVNLAGDAFADVNEMIANPVYRGIFWVTSFLALGGNLFVFVATSRDLVAANRQQTLFINTSIFILNLCVSDFLMGVYLLSIIARSTQFSGSYCLFDKAWRSSALCSGLGALAVVSSEASAFTMAAMTTFRLVSAFKPFLMRNASVTKTLIAELLCWIFSILIATVPLLGAASEYFVADVWFPNNFFETDFVSRENMSELAQRISNSKPNSWKDVKLVIKTAFPRSEINGEFGYYGETSVCMPRLFASTNDFAWRYSVSLITLNFLMFVYMVVAYLLIYKRSNRMKASRSTDVSSKMQKRITRLILTDFCCWIPICFMGFLSVGGVKMPGDVYVLSACLLLPINSALNPMLYSKSLEEQLSKLRKGLMSKLTSLRALKSNSSQLTVRFNPRAEQEDERVIEIVQ